MSMISDTPYRHVQGLSRGLQLLKALNGVDVSGATPRELSAKTGLNRTTVKRILETLVSEGYVRVCDCSGSYGLASQVRQLSDGITSEVVVLQCAAPAMQALGRQTRWSLRLSTLDRCCMVIRDSTHRQSDLRAESWGGLRHRMPLLLSSAGRAYFAHCDESERRAMAAALREAGDEQSAIAANPRLLQQLTDRVQLAGYALNDGDWGRSHLGAVALPIRDAQGHVRVSLSLLYHRRAFDLHTVRTELVARLREHIDAIEAEVRSRGLSA